MPKLTARAFCFSFLLFMTGCKSAMGMCDPNYVYEGIIFDVSILNDGQQQFIRLQGGAGGSAGAVGIVERKRRNGELNILIHNTCEIEPYRETSIDILVELDQNLKKITNGNEREVVWITEGK